MLFALTPQYAGKLIFVKKGRRLSLQYHERKDETIQQLADLYADAEIDFLDGITVQYADWWFNVRKSNTEPLLRLNLEANRKTLMNEKLDEVAQHLGTPVEH